LSQEGGPQNPILQSNQEYSLEDEIVKEISSNLVNKMDGLRVLFNEVKEQIAYQIPSQRQSKEHN